MELQAIMGPSIVPTRPLLSALQSIRPSDGIETDTNISLQHRAQSHSESRTVQGSMIMMQETRTLQYTSLRVQLAAPDQRSSTEGDPDEGYRAKLQAGLEKLIADNQRPLQDLLDYALLSDGQVLSVEYFSITLVQTTTVVVQQTSLPSVDALVEMLRDQFAAFMDRLFPGFEDYFGPEVLPPDERSDGKEAISYGGFK